MHTPPGDWLVPPVVLPELPENAVTHNQLTADNPLQMEIRLGCSRPQDLRTFRLRQGYGGQAGPQDLDRTDRFE
jgi:hypothetical protein